MARSLLNTHLFLLVYAFSMKTTTNLPKYFYVSKSIVNQLFCQNPTFAEHST